jgi:hypothetical protein
VKLAAYREVWLVDFEFGAGTGENPEPRCLVARELHSGRLVRLWCDDLQEAPWSEGDDVLFIAYYASAELGCLLALGWPIPTRILDLFTEFRNCSNGLTTPCGASLLGSLVCYGIDGIDAAEKDSMRDLALRRGQYTGAEKTTLLDYCQSDVDALAKLLPAMLPAIDLPRALLRGRYMAAAARIEAVGVPIDVETLPQLDRHWEAITRKLVDAVDVDYGVYVPTNRKRLDPQSKLGAVILKAAADHALDPYQLADAVDAVWEIEKKAGDEHNAAIAEARKQTGLTVNRIARWENCGNDYSTISGLDTKARELAGELPALGIGRGYDSETGYDDADHAGMLWELLRERSHRKSKCDPKIISQAVDMAIAAGGSPIPGPRTFSAARFADYLTRNNIPWPMLESGALDLKDETFRQMARAYPQIAPLRELRHSLSQLKLNELAVGSDGRNRCLLSAFQARTGRNQPSNSKFIFGPSVWLRALIRPEPGRAVAYVDWSQQEFGIAGALSGDANMMEAYRSGDPYLTFAKQAGAVPLNATKQTHNAERERFKACVLAVQYGMGSLSLANRLGGAPIEARELLRHHREAYPRFWEWSQAAVDHAMLFNYVQTVFGWKISVGTDANPRSLANFPCQANGAEMLRLACCLATERGIKVCAPVHDAILVEGPADSIESVVEATQAAMREASAIVLSGFELRTEAKIVGPGERYIDPRGEVMWNTIQGILDELNAVEAENAAAF